MANDMDAVLAALGRLEQGQTKLEQGQAKLEQGQATLEQGLAKLEHSFERLEADQTRLRVDTMARMDRMQQTLSSIKDDGLVNFGAWERVERRALASQAETQGMLEEFSHLQRRLRGLDERVRALEEPRASRG